MMDTGDIHSNVAKKAFGNENVRYIGKTYDDKVHRGDAYNVEHSGQITRVHGTRQRKHHVSTPGKLITKGALGRRSQRNGIGYGLNR